MQQRDENAGAGSADRVTDRDRAAVDVDAVQVGLQLAAPIPRVPPVTNATRAMSCPSLEISERSFLL